MGKYRSCARWSKIGKSTDEHNSLEMAKGVCWGLVTQHNHGMPCEIRGTCLEAWVEKRNENGEWVKVGRKTPD